MSFQGKKLINDPARKRLFINGTYLWHVVTECIDGLVETFPGLQYLDGFPEIKVVLRADVSGPLYDKVAVISGWFMFTVLVSIFWRCFMIRVDLLGPVSTNLEN